MKFLQAALVCLGCIFAGAILSAKLDQKTFEIGMRDLQDAREKYAESLSAANRACVNENEGAKKRVKDLEGQVETLKQMCVEEWK